MGGVEDVAGVFGCLAADEAPFPAIEAHGHIGQGDSRPPGQQHDPGEELHQRLFREKPGQQNEEKAFPAIVRLRQHRGAEEKQHQKALKILRENKSKLDEIAKFLYEKETITGDEFMEILNRKPEIAADAQPEIPQQNA